MASLFGQVRAEFAVVGELSSKRIVTSSKQPDWKLYVLKFAVKGSTVEVEVSLEEYDRAVLEEPYQVSGTIKAENGRTKLLGDKVDLLKAPQRASA